MSRLICIVLFALLAVPLISQAQTIDVHIRGIDDGVKTTKKQDYKEAVLFAKHEAIKRAGTKIKSLTTVKDMVLSSDYIEAKAEEVLLQGYDIVDIGYTADGTYQVVLIGKVKQSADKIDSKELRYAKSLVDRGKKSKAKKIIISILRNNKDDNTVAEAMYYFVIWGFSRNPTEMFERMKAYYPDSRYVGQLKSYFDEMSDEELREITIKAKIGNIIDKDGRFIAGDKGIVLDTKTGLMWAAKDNGRDINWRDAKRYCEIYRGGGYADWRMPTLNELVNLFDPSWKNRHGGYYITKLIGISACAPWSSNTQGSIALVGYFCDTGPRGARDQSRFLIGRALPVRDDK